MIVIAIISLILGIACGHWFFSESLIHIFSTVSVYILYILMFSVGISLGTNRMILKKMKEYNLSILTIPIGIIVGSILGGIVSSFILNMPLKESVSISSSMGWYSLSGVLMTELAGADVGTIAFFSNLIREFISYMTVPIIAKYFNSYTTIASAGATSMDTSLPIIIKYVGTDMAILAVINGVICSTLVPIFVPFFYNIFNIVGL